MQPNEIVDLIKNKDENGIKELLHYSEPLIRYIINPILRDEREKEECLSDITLLIWNKIDTYNPERGSWNTWVTAIAHNTALNRARRNKHLNDDELSTEIISPEPTPEERVLQSERQEAFMRAFNKLALRDRALFYRKYYYMQPTAQIAAELSMTERAVEGKLYRLKKRLRKMLGGELND